MASRAALIPGLPLLTVEHHVIHDLQLKIKYAFQGKKSSKIIVGRRCSYYTVYVWRNTMTTRAVLLREIETLPANCIGEVVDFVAWIKYRKLSQLYGKRDSSSVLCKICNIL